MRFVPLLFLIIPEILHSMPVHLDACDYTVDLKDFKIEQVIGDSLRATTPRGNHTWTLLGFCKTNQKRTTPVAEIVSEAKERGDFIRAVETIEARTLGPVLVLRKTSRENPVTRIEATFATREFEYKFVLVPDNGRDIRSDEWERAQRDLSEIIRTSEARNQSAAITEEKYRTRLIVFFILASVLLTGMCAFALRMILRRKRK